VVILAEFVEMHRPEPQYVMRLTRAEMLFLADIAFELSDRPGGRGYLKVDGCLYTTADQELLQGLNNSLDQVMPYTVDDDWYERWTPAVEDD
jgi:hypothetical protein